MSGHVRPGPPRQPHAESWSDRVPRRSLGVRIFPRPARKNPRPIGPNAQQDPPNPSTPSGKRIARLGG